MIVVTHEMAFARDVSSHVVFIWLGLRYLSERVLRRIYLKIPKNAKTRDFLTGFFDR